MVVTDTRVGDENARKILRRIGMNHALQSPSTLLVASVSYETHQKCSWYHISLNPCTSLL